MTITEHWHVDVFRLAPLSNLLSLVLTGQCIEGISILFFMMKRLKGLTVHIGFFMRIQRIPWEEFVKIH